MTSRNRTAEGHRNQVMRTNPDDQVTNEQKSQNLLNERRLQLAADYGYGDKAELPHIHEDDKNYDILESLDYDFHVSLADSPDNHDLRVKLQAVQGFQERKKNSVL